DHDRARPGAFVSANKALSHTDDPPCEGDPRRRQEENSSRVLSATRGRKEVRKQNRSSNCKGTLKCQYKKSPLDQRPTIGFGRCHQLTVVGDPTRSLFTLTPFGLLDGN